MLKRFRLPLLLALASITAFAPLPARATTLSAIGGLSVGRNSGLNDIKSPSPLLGVEYALDLGSRLQFGGFFENNFVTHADMSTGSLRFMGALVRFNAREGRVSTPYVDAKAGLAVNNKQDASNAKISFGAGLGCRFAVSERVSLGPRIGVKFMPSSPSGQAANEALVDGALVLSLNF